MSLPRSRTLWEEGREPGHELAALGVALALTAATADLVLTGEVGVLFDLALVATCVGLALAVRPGDFYTVGVLPPLLVLGTMWLLALGRPEAIARPGDGVVQALVSGLSHHSVALAVGHLLCLGVLLVRQRVAALRVTRSGPGPRLPA